MVNKVFKALYHRPISTLARVDIKSQIACGFVFINFSLLAPDFFLRGNFLGIKRLKSRYGHNSLFYFPVVFSQILHQLFPVNFSLDSFEGFFIWNFIKVNHVYKSFFQVRYRNKKIPVFHNVKTEHIFWLYPVQNNIVPKNFYEAVLNFFCGYYDSASFLLPNFMYAQGFLHANVSRPEAENRKRWVFMRCVKSFYYPFYLPIFYQIRRHQVAVSSFFDKELHVFAAYNRRFLEKFPNSRHVLYLAHLSISSSIFFTEGTAP